MRFCRRLVSLSSDARILSDSRTCRTSSQAEPSTLAPFQIRKASTITTAEFSAAIDRMRQRIGTARSTWTMRKRPRAAKPAGRSTVPSWFRAPSNSLHLANSFDQLPDRGVALRLGIEPGHRRLERLAVEIRHDPDACGLRLLARAFLEIPPLFAHEAARSQRRLAKNLLVLG